MIVFWFEFILGVLFCCCLFAGVWFSLFVCVAGWLCDNLCLCCAYLLGLLVILWFGCLVFACSWLRCYVCFGFVFAVCGLF